MHVFLSRHRKSIRKGTSGEESSWAAEISSQTPWPGLALDWEMERKASFLYHIPPSPEFWLSESTGGLPVTKCRRREWVPQEMDPGWRDNPRAYPAWSHRAPNSWNSFSDILQPTVQRRSLGRWKKTQGPQPSGEWWKRVLVMSKLEATDLLNLLCTSISISTNQKIYEL